MKYFAILVILCKLAQVKHLKMFKVGCAFWMAISSDFRMGKHRDDNHEENAPYFRIEISAIFKILQSPE